MWPAITYGRASRIVIQSRGIEDYLHKEVVRTKTLTPAAIAIKHAVTHSQRMQVNDYAPNKFEALNILLLLE